MSQCVIGCLRCARGREELVMNGDTVIIVVRNPCPLRLRDSKKMNVETKHLNYTKTAIIKSEHAVE